MIRWSKRISVTPGAFLAIVNDWEGQQLLNRVTCPTERSTLLEGSDPLSQLNSWVTWKFIRTAGNLHRWESRSDQAKTEKERSKLALEFRMSKKHTGRSKRLQRKCLNVRGVFGISSHCWRLLAGHPVVAGRFLHFHRSSSGRKGRLVPSSFATYRMSCRESVQSDARVRHRGGLCLLWARKSPNLQPHGLNTLPPPVFLVLLFFPFVSFFFFFFVFWVFGSKCRVGTYCRIISLDNFCIFSKEAVISKCERG